MKRRDIKYSVGDHVFLKVSSLKKVLQFGCKDKQSLKFIEPYQILKRGGPIAYQLELPSELDHIYYVFQVFILRRYLSDPSHIVSLEEIEVRSDLNFDEEPIQILERDVNVLRRKTIPLLRFCGRIMTLRKPFGNLRTRFDNNICIY
ncbi:uncharacterized protein LOC108458591 [Gossypium arboreum]|uniref:uncharacterized protein LOC108458591 n=1 Tax=Gossypium arboreum TaxID=29729 RepID=UPI000819431E|nr:uncharacterized protein LOC108458591 [Gossypium arboreum]